MLLEQGERQVSTTGRKTTCQQQGERQVSTTGRKTSVNNREKDNVSTTEMTSSVTSTGTCKESWSIEIIPNSGLVFPTIISYFTPFFLIDKQFEMQLS